VDSNDDHHSDSKDETALSASASRAEHSHPGTNAGAPAPLTPNGHHKVDKKSTKHQQVPVQFHLLVLVLAFFFFIFFFLRYDLETFEEEMIFFAKD
jgi:type VI protein secretion system component VasF